MSPEFDRRAFRDLSYGIGDCENRGAHSHNRHHELNLGLGEAVRIWAMGIQQRVFELVTEVLGCWGLSEA